MKTLARISSKWWFFIMLFLLQFLLVPYASVNFDWQHLNDIIYTTLGNAFQTKLGDSTIYFQTLSLLLLVALFIFRNRMRFVFNLYVTLSYALTAIIQNLAVTEKYGLSIVTVNVIMFLFVAYVWLQETLHPENDYSFANFKWKYSWMIILSLFAYLCPLATDGFNFNPLHFFHKNSATAFCLITPLFLTIMTLNIPRINIVTYRITAIIGTIIGFYNMFAFFNPYTVNLGILHIPLLTVSLYAWILSYRIKKDVS